MNRRAKRARPGGLSPVQPASRQGHQPGPARQSQGHQRRSSPPASARSSRPVPGPPASGPPASATRRRPRPSGAAGLATRRVGGGRGRPDHRGRGRIAGVRLALEPGRHGRHRTGHADQATPPVAPPAIVPHPPRPPTAATARAGRQLGRVVHLPRRRLGDDQLPGHQRHLLGRDPPVRPYRAVALRGGPPWPASPEP